jgi:DNA primase
MALAEWLEAAIAASTLTPEARDYLMGRGATPEVIETWGLTVFDCPLEPCPQENLHGHHGKHFDRYEGKIVYPLRTPSGGFLGFESRSIDRKDYDQYLLPPSRWNPLWIGMPVAMGPIWEGRDVIVVEGAFDAFAMLHVAGDRAVLGSGTAKLSWKQTDFMERWVTGRVHIAYDRDPTGRQGTEDVLKNLSLRGVQCSELRYGTAGDDPGSIWDRGGGQALRESFPQL